jgi:hypothetical protein
MMAKLLLLSQSETQNHNNEAEEGSPAAGGPSKMQG